MQIIQKLKKIREALIVLRDKKAEVTNRTKTAIINIIGDVDLALNEADTIANNFSRYNNDTVVTIKDEKISEGQTLISEEDKAIKGSSTLHHSQPHSETKKVELVEPPKSIPIIKTNAIKRYLYAPEDDGSFSNDKKNIKDSPDRETIFELTLLEDNNAELRIVNDSKIHQIAITNYQTYLKRIAIKKSGSNLNARKIIVNEPGKYMLENNKWILKEKIIITLI